MNPPTVTEGSDAAGGASSMNTAGRYQSRRNIGHAFDSITQQKLQVHTEERRGSIVTGPQKAGGGRRRSIAIPEIHFEVTSTQAESDDPATRIQAMLHANKDRESFMEKAGDQMNGEQHQTLLSVHGDILSRTVPPQLTLELYREVVPILGQCVKAYTNSLGRNHQLTAECIERHRECSARLRQLQLMHDPPPAEKDSSNEIHT